MTEPDPTPTPPAEDGATPPAPAPTPDADEPLGPPGLRALGAERERAEAAERRIREMEQRFAPLEQLAAALGGAPAGDTRTDLERLTERLAQHETDLAAERSARWRAEVAAEKHLTPGQAKFLTGSSREELLNSADELLAVFPAAPPPPPNTPRPDPSQGAKGGPTDTLDAQIAEAEKQGNHALAISLKARLLDQL